MSREGKITLHNNIPETSKFSATSLQERGVGPGDGLAKLLPDPSNLWMFSSEFLTPGNTGVPSITDWEY